MKSCDTSGDTVQARMGEREENLTLGYSFCLALFSKPPRRKQYEYINYKFSSNLSKVSNTKKGISIKEKSGDGHFNYVCR